MLNVGRPLCARTQIIQDWDHPHHTYDLEKVSKIDWNSQDSSGFDSNSEVRTSAEQRPVKRIPANSLILV